jgi:hypothetical protein
MPVWPAAGFAMQAGSPWVAVRGKRTLVAASSPKKLIEQVEAATRGEAGPDEGDKTQAWRAPRQYGRG